MVKHVLISGRVQGVGFRYFTHKNAQKLGLKGWVKNLDDGRVEAVFEGNPSDVRQMLNLCEKGPMGSYVKEIQVDDVNTSLDTNTFEVKR